MIDTLALNQTLMSQLVELNVPLDTQWGISQTRCELLAYIESSTLPTGLILRTLCPFNVFILFNGWICLYSVLD